MLKIKTTVVLNLVFLLILSSCNIGGSSNNNAPTNPVLNPLPTPSNSNLIVNITPNGREGQLCGNINIPCVSVTICSPTNPTSCQTIDNVLIDSGSVGLRIFKSILNSSLVLPLESAGNSTIANCVGYGDLSANWGPLAIANITLSNESTTQSIPIQLIDSSYANGGSKCLNSFNNTRSSFHLENSPEEFGFNGILGVAPIIYDNITGYFSCTDSLCLDETEIIHEVTSLLMTNPIAFLPESYGSGITFKLPTLDNNGATNVVGYAIFGVGSNNDNIFESGINIYHIYTDGSSNCNYYLFICMPTTLLTNTTIQYGFLDTGSNFFSFNDDNISNTDGFYTPNSMRTLYASNTSENGEVITTSFNIANIYNLFNNTNNTAFNNNGANGFDGFLDYGLPFFFGKTVYICFQDKTCNGIPGPYWAF